MATLHQLRGHLGTLTAILWNYGATLPVPTLHRYDSGEVGFSFAAELPGSATPQPAVIRSRKLALSGNASIGQGLCGRNPVFILPVYGVSGDVSY